MLCLNLGNEALLLRAHLLRSAQSEILIQTFIWKNDECGRYLAMLILEAAKRGVKVKIVVDAWPGLDFPALLVSLEDVHENIHLKFYNPPDKKITPDAVAIAKEALVNTVELSHRMHSKAFIADGTIAIIGGRNYENTYYDRSPGRNFKDREVAVCGPVACEAREVFWKYWDAGYSYHPKQLKDYKTELEKGNVTLHAGREDFSLGDGFDELDSQCRNETCMQSLFRRMKHVEKIEFVADPPGIKENTGTSNTLHSLKKLFQSAERELLLQTPYFVLDSFQREVFEELLKRQAPVDIRISTNSLAATDNIIAYGTAIRDREKFISQIPLRIFEFRPRPYSFKDMLGYTKHAEEQLNKQSDLQADTPYKGFHLCLHAKTYIVDDHTTCITSANMDPRSIYTNTEEGVIIYDREFTAQVKSDLERDIAPRNSWAVAPLPRSMKKSVFQKITFAGLSGGTPTSCFELKDGQEPVSCYDPEFFDRYREVGRFPQAGCSFRHFQAMFIALVAKGIKPYV